MQLWKEARSNMAEETVKYSSGHDIKPKTIRDFTTGTNNGTGVFDIMMTAVEGHIQEEFKSQRITGSNYAQIYLQTLQSVLQVAGQFTLSQDQTWLELEKLKLERDKLAYEIDKLKAEAELARAQVEIAKAQIEVEKAKLPLIKAQTLTEQAKTMDIIDSGEDIYNGDKTNIHGLGRAQLDQTASAIDSQNKANAINLAKELTVNPFSIIESSEGIGSSYYGLNGGNTVSYLNEVRKAFGMKEINTTSSYAGEHAKYKDYWAPGKSIAEDDDTDSDE